MTANDGRRLYVNDVDSEMSSLSYSRARLIVLIVLAFVVWQTIRCLSWFQFSPVATIDHGPSDNGLIIPVTVTVFYETLCPDSKSFVLKHLLPTVTKAPRLVTVKLVPYGKAKTEEDGTGDYGFACQHGAIECLGNKVHGCGISKIKDQILQVKYVACMITDNMNPEVIGKKCAEELNIDWDPIHKCYTTLEGTLLMKENGDLTHALQPKVTFIPTVLLDEMHMNQPAILKNLFKEVCLMFKKAPAECVSTMPDILS